MKKHLILFVLSAVILCICGCGSTDGNSLFGSGGHRDKPVDKLYSVSGKVVSFKDLSPLQNVEVSIEPLAGGETQKVFTDAAGYYQINNLTLGDYKVTYLKPGSGYGMEYRDITISADGLEMADVIMNSSLLNRCYGGTHYDFAYSIIETSDGCLALAGYTSSPSGGDVPDRGGRTGNYDMWVLKIDPRQTDHSRSIIFNQCYGGAENDYAYSIIETSDGCLGLAGYTDSPSGGDVPDRGGRTGNYDMWVLKINDKGEYKL